MREISLAPILVFNGLFFLATAIAYLIVFFIFKFLPITHFKEVIIVILFFVLFYLSLILLYRLFLKYFPLVEGEKAENSQEEFIYNVYLLFYLIPFQPLIKSKLIPISLMRVVYILLGANLGSNTYSSGVILDPPLTTIGKNTLLGEDSLLIAHVIEGKKIAHYPIIIGNNVTIGARAVIMAGVTIEDGAIVAAGAVVRKGQEIRIREVWGGIPAKRIKILSMDN